MIMAKEVFVNIKDLPEITDLAAGQYIILETPTGTQIIDFENFILPPANTTITTSVSQQADSIALLNTKYDILSSTVDTNTSSLSDSITTNYNTLSTQINTLSGKIDLLNPLYIGKCTITIPATNSSGSNRIVPDPTSTTLTLDDFMIFPANSYAANNLAYPLSYDATTKILTIKGNFKTKTLTFNESNPYSISSSTALSELSTNSIGNVLNTLQYTETDGTAIESAIYNVIVVKKL
jgi:hypothetical protein